MDNAIDGGTDAKEKTFSEENLSSLRQNFSADEKLATLRFQQM